MVVDESWEIESSIWEGDLLVVSPSATVASGSNLLVLEKDGRRMLATTPRIDWQVEGVVLGQYRSHA